MSFGRIILRWETAYASGYKLQTSNNAQTWTDIYSTTTGNGGVDTVSVSATGRYVRMLGVTRATAYGYSLYEFEIYQMPTATAISKNPSAHESIRGSMPGIGNDAYDRYDVRGMKMPLTRNRLVPHGISIVKEKGVLARLILEPMDH
jgi:hypothetical protein